MVIVSMCTIPERKDDLLKVLNSILYQQTHPIDRLLVYLNGYKEMPDFLPSDRRTVYRLEPSNPGPWKRYEPTETISNEDVFITIDDDIVYPEDYVITGIKYLSNPKHDVICFFGFLWDPFVDYFSYGNYRWQYSFNKQQTNKKVIAILGGATGFSKGKAIKKIVTNELPGFMTNDDLMVGYQLQKREIPIHCCPKPANWIQEAPSSRKDNALFITDSSMRKKTFSRLCTELCFDPTAGLLNQLLMNENRILIWSQFSPFTKVFKDNEATLEKISRKENTTVHILIKVAANEIDAVQQMTDKPYFIHPVVIADASGRMNQFFLVRQWREKRIQWDFQQEWNERSRIILEKLNPIEKYHLQINGLLKQE